MTIPRSVVLLALLAFAALVGASASILPAESVAATSVQLNVNASSFDYPGGVAISAVQYVKGHPGALTLTVYGMEVGGSAQIYADLSNQTGSTVTFTGGATVLVAITKDGQPWDQVTLTNPALSRLSPGQQATLQTSVTLGSPGVYGLTGALSR
ncbi:MAG TPA: hypothetical protein VKY26_00560 [Actinomycetota bacterium]|nr:hypothetical protein [Actinomycetota bacterium]